MFIMPLCCSSITWAPSFGKQLMICKELSSSFRLFDRIRVRIFILMIEFLLALENAR